jgi:hypothetical protein
MNFEVENIRTNVGERQTTSCNLLANPAKPKVVTILLYIFLVPGHSNCLFCACSFVIKNPLLHVFNSIKSFQKNKWKFSSELSIRKDA